MTGRKSTRMVTGNTKGATIVPPLILVPSLADQRPTNEVPIGEVARHRRLVTRPDTTDDVVVAVQLDFTTIVMHDSAPVVSLDR